MEEYADIYGGIYFDDETVSHVVKLFHDAPSARLAGAKEALESIPLTHGISIHTEASGFILAERQELMDRIIGDLEGWGTRIGTEIVSVRVDDDNGNVVVGVADKADASALSFTEDNIPIVIIERSVELQAGTRRDDRGFWTGGNWIATSNRSSTGVPNCTLGFTWRRWGMSGTWGGIAKHCPVETGISQWWHNGRRLGDYVYGHPGSDAALLAPEPNTAFSPTVWVGGTSTNVERNVVGAMPVPERGLNTALSGGVSGLQMDEIIDTDEFVIGLGNLVVTDGTTCDHGDSGAPWLNTQSDGDVIAHGQHMGRLLMDGGNVNCAYLPVTRISAMIEASILTYP